MKAEAIVEAFERFHAMEAVREDSLSVEEIRRALSAFAAGARFSNEAQLLVLIGMAKRIELLSGEDIFADELTEAAKHWLSVVHTTALVMAEAAQLEREGIGDADQDI